MPSYCQFNKVSKHQKNCNKVLFASTENFIVKTPHPPLALKPPRSEIEVGHLSHWCTASMVAGLIGHGSGESDWASHRIVTCLYCKSVCMCVVCVFVTFQTICCFFMSRCLKVLLLLLLLLWFFSCVICMFNGSFLCLQSEGRYICMDPSW